MRGIKLRVNNSDLAREADEASTRNSTVKCQKLRKNRAFGRGHIRKTTDPHARPPPIASVTNRSPGLI